MVDLYICKEQVTQLGLLLKTHQKISPILRSTFKKIPEFHAEIWLILSVSTYKLTIVVFRKRESVPKAG